jgi:lysophospholipase L1-like esterase
MASVNFSGQLDRPLNEEAAGGDKIYFYPLNTVGEIIQSAASIMTIDESGNYDITLGYNNYSLYYYSDVSKKQTYIANVTVSADTVVSTLPDLIGSTTPVTEEAELIIQGYLSEAQQAVTDSQSAQSASELAQSEAESARDDVLNRVASYEVETTEYLINTFDSSGLSTGDVVKTLGCYTAGDGGGAEWVKTGDTSTVSQTPGDRGTGELTTQSGDVFEYHNKSSFSVPANVMGAVMDGVTDDTDPVNAATNFAYSNNIRFVEISGECNIDGDINEKGNVIYVGSGSFPNNTRSSVNNVGIYRKEVIEFNAESAKAFIDHNMLFTPTIDDVIVVTGDSLSTFGADTLTPFDGITIKLLQKFSEAAGADLSDNFYGRGIHAQTLVDLDGVSDSDLTRYPWYTDTSRDWLDYVADLNPTVVVVAMGMNDKKNFSKDSFKSVISKIEAMGAQPVFCTSNVPSLVYETYQDFDEQEGRDYNAGYIRSYCYENKIALIDINRTFNVVRDGRDILDTRFELTSNYELSNGFFQLPTDNMSRDLLINFTISGDSFDDSGIVAVNMSSYWMIDNVVFIDDSSGFLRFRFYEGYTSGESGATLYKTIISDIATPTTDTEYEMTIKGNWFGFREWLSPSGVRDGTIPLTTTIIRGGGLQTFRIYKPGTGLGTVTSVRSAYVSRERQYMPYAIDDDIYLKTDNAGNNINHPSSKGAQYIYSEHFKYQDYSKVRLIKTVESSVTGYKQKLYSDGTVTIEGAISLGGSSVATGNVYSTGRYEFVYPESIKSVDNVSVTAHLDDSLSDANLWVSNDYDSPLSQIGIKAYSWYAYSDTDTITAIVKVTGRWR